ncbi:MAG: exosortase-associated EpsI family protein [Phycisphaeraceae bacterium]
MSTTVTSARKDVSPQRLISPPAWGWIALLGGLFIALHWPFVYRMFLIATTNGDARGLNPDWGHMLLVPFISGFFIYQHRYDLLAASRRVCGWGLPIFFAGLFAFALGIFPVQNSMAQGMGMILTLFGLVLFLLGPGAMRWLWFPILYLMFFIKVSDRLWDKIAWNLQQIAAKGATIVLQFVAAFNNDFDVTSRSSTIELVMYEGGQVVRDGLNVAEACSGLRMLMAFLALAVAMAFLWNRAWWQRLTMILLAVPIAVGINVGRVTALGLLFLIDPKYAHGSFHTFVGMLMLIPAALVFLLLGWVLDKIIIREGGDEDADEAASRPAVADVPAGPARLAPGAIGLGTALGGGLTLLLGLAYLLLAAWFAPDVLPEAAPAWTAPALLPVVLLALAGLAMVLPRLLERVKQHKQQAAAGLIAAALLVALVGQNGVVAATETVLIKQPLPLRHTLAAVPTQFGPWEMVSEDPPLSAEVLETLGTEKYISRIYEDTTWPGGPGGELRLHIAYYTGTPDLVPHVPDRCFVAAGMQPMDKTLVELNLDEAKLRDDPESDYLLAEARNGRVRVPGEQIDATYFTYAASDNPQNGQSVIYFFMANGQTLATPDLVRLHGFDPTDRYSYYAKVEVQAFGITDEELVRERVSSLLDHALPEILFCLPDWHEVQQGTYPREDESH